MFDTLQPKAIGSLLPFIVMLLRASRLHGFSVPAFTRTRRPSWLPATTTRALLSLSSSNTKEDALWLPSHDKPIRAIAAPMVGASDYAFRCLCRQYGVDLTFTQMLRAENLLDNVMFQKTALDIFEFSSSPNSTPPPRINELNDLQQKILRGYDLSKRETMPIELDRFRRGPVVAQLAGNDANTVVRAAQLVLKLAPDVSGFDLNCGCPESCARDGHYGAFLMEADNGIRACKVLSALREHLPPHVAVSAKIRLPLKEDALEDRVHRLVATGINFLTIHGRTLREKKKSSEEARIDRIREAVQIASSIKPGFPIVANGAIEFLPDVDRVRTESQTVAVMSSEALLETPQLFQRDVSLLSPRERLEEQFQIAYEYMRWASLYPPPPIQGTVVGSFTIIREHLFKFLYTYLHEHTDIRDRLGNKSVDSIVQAKSMVDELYSRYSNLKDEDLLQLARPNSSWYRRHWDSNEVSVSSEPQVRRPPLFITRASSVSSSENLLQNDEALWLPSHDKPIRSIAAPMVAASDYAFRCLCRQYGVDLTFTQMLHAKNLLGDVTFRQNHLDMYEFSSPNSAPPPPINELNDAQRKVLKGYDLSLRETMPAELDRFRRGPVVVQLAGNDANTVVRAAQLVLKLAPDVSGFDLNCGCPQGIARRGNYGAFFMEADNGNEACQVLSALRDNLPPQVAVSAKIRLPLEEDALEERIRRLVATGVNFLTIHGRTVKENKQLVAEAHTDRIREAVQIANSIKPGFPIVANGGIEFMPDVDRVRTESQTVAVMSSEALLETPQVFHHDMSLLSPRERLEEQFKIAYEYLGWAALYPPLPGVQGECGSFNTVRGHLFKFLHNYVREHTDIRDRLANYNLNRLVQAYHIVDDLCSRYSNLKDEDLLQYSSWYRRHRATNEDKKRSVGMPTDELSVQDRKEMAKERISRLRAQREARNSVSSLA